MVDISFTIILQWVNFGILFFLLTKLLYRPITRYLDSRRSEIESNLKDADKARKEAETTLSKYQAKLDDAAREGQKIIFQARNEGQEERSNILAQAREDASAVMDKARQQIQLQEEKARSRLRRETVDLSISIAGKLMKKELDRRDQEKFIRESMEKMKDLNAR